MAYQEYTVQEGDTLWGIARRHGMSWRRLYDYDGDTGTPNSERLESGDPDVIHVGEVILIPARSDRRGGNTGSEENVFVCPDPEEEGGRSNLMVRVQEVSNDAPIRDASVTISGPTRSEGTTDVNGEFQAEGLSPGTYSVTASRNGFTARNQPVEREIGAATSNVVEVQLAAQSRIEIVEDHNGSFSVDENSPTVDFVRFGIWDNAFDGSGNLKNQQDEQNNIVGTDTRRFYFRVEDPLANDTVEIRWKTLRSNRRDDDVPADCTLTLKETSNGSHVFVSKAVMLVTDNTDRDCDTHSGYGPPLAIAGIRSRGQSNHRIRKGKINGYVKGEYSPVAGGVTLSVEKPIFKRNPDDERKQVEIRVINYGGNATQGYINGQIAHANDRWNQVGLQISTGASSSRPVPAGALDGAGRYTGSANNAGEQATLADLIPITPDDTITVVFVRKTGSNAYATIAQRNPVNLPDGSTVTLGARYFVFLNTNLNINGDTLAHELHHVLFNRFDTNTPRQFYPFNTKPSTSYGVALPDARIRRRIQNMHTPDPNNDPNNNNIINWMKRQRTARFPIGGGNSAATNTTGNTLVEDYT